MPLPSIPCTPNRRLSSVERRLLVVEAGEHIRLVEGSHPAGTPVQVAGDSNRHRIDH